MSDGRIVAGAAYQLARRQLALLKQGDFDAFDAGFRELESLYAELLQTPIEELDDEAQAITRELVAVHRSICAELSRLMQEADDAMAVQRRRQSVSSAYNGPANDPGVPRSA